MSVLPEPGGSAGLDRDEGSPARNQPAAIGFLLGIACLVVNPVLLLGLAAVVVSGIGLNRAALMGQHGYSAVGRSKAVWGLALGVLGTIASIAFKNSLF